MRTKPVIVDKNLFDDLEEHKEIVPVKNVFMDKIVAAGKRDGLKLEGFYVPKIDRVIIFVTNKLGIRQEFWTIGDDRFRPINTKDVLDIERFLWINRDLKKRRLFYKELREKRFEWQEKGQKEQQEKLQYMMGQYQRTFRSLNRLIGDGQGKVYLPHGPSFKRNLPKEKASVGNV